MMKAKIYSHLIIATTMIVAYSSASAVITPQAVPCSAHGEGLVLGDTFMGVVSGDETQATGAWRHETSTGLIFESTGTFRGILCRLDGITMVDFDGPATVDGVSGFTMTVRIQDYSIDGVDVSPNSAPPTDNVRADFYTLFIFDDASGALVYLIDGEIGPIPEPSAAVLLMMAGGAFMLHRRVAN